MDLTGLMSVLTWDGYLYTLVIVEVSCHYCYKTKVDRYLGLGLGS